MLRLLGGAALVKFPNRRCFYAVAIEAMKQVLIDHHRAKNSEKRGGDCRRVPLDDVLEVIEREARADFGDLHVALDDLKQQSPRQHDVVQLRFFGGLTIDETAEMLEVSTATVERDFRVAKAKLYVALSDDMG